MYVSSIFLDRFGRRANLRVADLSNGLTVIFGPHGSGKTTLVDFLRAMWNGFDSQMRERYVPPESRGFGGAVSVQTAHGRQTICRYDDGGPEGRLTVEREDGAVIGRRHVHDLFGDVSAKLLDRAFLVDFQRPQRLDELLSAAAARGCELWESPASPERLLAVHRLLAEKRERLAQLSSAPETLASSRQQRREMPHNNVSSAEVTQRDLDERARHRQRLRETVAELVRREIVVSQEFASWDRTWNELGEQRRRMASTPAATVPGAPHLTSQLRRLNSQLARWKRTLRDVVKRKQRAAERSDHRQLEAVSVAAADVNPCQHLLALETRIEDLQRSWGGISDQDRECVGQELRAAFADSLQAMRDHLNELNRWQSHFQHRQAMSERDQLARCEMELKQAIQSLVQRRQTLLVRMISANSATSCSAEHASQCQDVEHSRPATVPDACQHDSNRDQKLAASNAEQIRVDELRHKTRRELDETTVQLAAACAELQELGSGPFPRNARTEGQPGVVADLDQSVRDAELRRDLLQEIGELEEEWRRLRDEFSSINLIREASQYLRQLSCHEWSEIHATSPQEVWVKGVQGRRLPYDDLDSGTRDQVYLALCLAVVAACDRDGIRIPLVINAAFTHYPSKNVRDALELLRNFGHDRQVLCLTRHDHVVSLARLLNVPVHQLSNAEAAVGQPRETVVSTESRRPLVQLENRAPPVAKQDSRAERANAEVSPDRLTDRIRIHRTGVPKPLAAANTSQGAPQAAAKHSAPDATSERTVVEYYLSENDPVERAPSIDPTSANRLRKIGFQRVGDLLRVSAAEIAADLRQWGITADIVQSWQSQVRLMCRVRRLRSYDARILVACGITDPDQLSDMNSATLRMRVKEFSASAAGQAILLSGTESELSRVTDWVQLARDDGRHKWPRTDGGSRAAHADRGTPGPQTKRARANRDSSRGVRDPNERAVTRDSRRVGEKSGVVPLSAGEQTFHFLLQRSSAVVDAPSIGSNMAKRLGKIGIVSVADLLNANAETIAMRLQMNRVTAATVRQWQQQTELVCCVPQLRAHEAQILVAVGVTNVEALAAVNSNDVWRRVQPFCETLEGKRILRHATEPDAAKVADWVYWARHARTLNAA